MRAHMAAIALLVVCAFLAPACIATVDSTSSEINEPNTNMTPAQEPVGEAAQDLLICECSINSDYCPWTVGGKCVANFNACTRTPARGCGFAGLYPCVGWCVRR